MTFDQQAEELGLEDALEDTVILLFVNNEDVILQSADGHDRTEMRHLGQ